MKVKGEDKLLLLLFFSIEFTNITCNYHVYREMNNMLLYYINVTYCLNARLTRKSKYLGFGVIIIVFILIKY